MKIPIRFNTDNALPYTRLVHPRISLDYPRSNWTTLGLVWISLQIMLGSHRLEKIRHQIIFATSPLTVKCFMVNVK